MDADPAIYITGYYPEDITVFLTFACLWWEVIFRFHISDHVHPGSNE